MTLCLIVPDTEAGRFSDVGGDGSVEKHLDGKSKSEPGNLGGGDGGIFLFMIHPLHEPSKVALPAFHFYQTEN